MLSKPLYMLYWLRPTIPIALVGSLVVLKSTGTDLVILHVFVQQGNWVALRSRSDDEGVVLVPPTR